MEFIYSFFNIISIFITDLLYDIDIVNNLFSFDLTKKKVLIKYKKKEEKENIDNAPLNIFEPKIIENNIMNLNENIQNDIKKDENSLINTQEISAKKKKKRGSKKLYSSNLSNIQNNKEEKETAELNEKKNLYKKNNSIINQKNGTMFSNDRIIPDSRNKNNSADKKEETMIKENVDINNFFIIFAFC